MANEATLIVNISKSNLTNGNKVVAVISSNENTEITEANTSYLPIDISREVFELLKGIFDGYDREYQQMIYEED